MSWDIVVFSSKQRIGSIEEIDEKLLVPIDFNVALEKHFESITGDSNHKEINAENYSIEYFANTEPTSNMVFSLYGELAIFELIKAAQKYDWQIFDTGNGRMLDLDHPEKNGFNDFQSYLRHVLRGSDDKNPN